MKNLIITLIIFLRLALFVCCQTTFTFSLKVFLEGPFDGTAMATHLNPDLIPLNQPYNVAPWDYTGSEQLVSMPNSDIVDWILIELRETEGADSTATPDKIIHRQAALLKSDGNIVALDGAGTLSFTGDIQLNLYLVLYHRNHLAVMSATPLVETAGTFSYDFTNQLSKAYHDGQKQIGTGLFGMIGGDCDASGRIYHADKYGIWFMQAGSNGYLQSDINLDGESDNFDKNDMFLINYYSYTKVPAFIGWECSDDFVDDRNGEIYGTVQMGDVCVMTKNMNIGTMIYGSGTDNGIIEKSCYNTNPSNCEIFGGLYFWNEMMQYSVQEGIQGICPSGWHIPSDNEWKLIEGYADTQYGIGNPVWDITNDYRGFDAGKKLKSETGWNGTNDYNFSILPAGYKEGSNYFTMGSYAYFWTSTLNTNYIRRVFKSDSDQIYRHDDGTDYWAFSVRCCKTNNVAPVQPYNPVPPDSSQGVPVIMNLSWSCYDLNLDTLNFDVYFGTELPLQIVSTDQLDYSFDPGILESNTVYFWRIIAKDNKGGLTEGPTWSFETISTTGECGAFLVDDRDNHVYNIILIGTQCWMAENINIGTFSTGQSNNGIIEKYCYGNIELNCNTYGGLYLWNEMMQYSTLPGTQGICPSGWHIPTDDEWKLLEGTVDSQYGVGNPVWNTTGYRGYDAGKRLKSGLGWNSGNGTDEFAFTVLPAGYREGGNYYTLGEYAYFWTSTIITNYNRRVFKYNSDQIYRANDGSNNWAFSVRCLKD